MSSFYVTVGRNSINVNI
uniref:Uncharacterized protein n=1 Tax=Anguilla anguilla TaxID=7936 RepID=A0A0E9R5J9_ANGAN